MTHDAGAILIEEIASLKAEFAAVEQERNRLVNSLWIVSNFLEADRTNAAVCYLKELFEELRHSGLSGS